MRVPVSTYRLQITAVFDLHAAARVLPMLHDLGVDWVYLSPLLEAEPGSDHGYDVIDHRRIDPARGGAEGLAVMSAEARRLGMGVLVDIVPNHVGVATPHLNAWWWELLRDGATSEHAARFDVDWDVAGGRIRIPVLGDEDVLANGRAGNLRLAEGPDGPELCYHDTRYPVAAGTAGNDPDEVHERQHYELVSWRAADVDLNYRRFFAINTLAAIRVEDPQVLADSHVEIRRWFDEELVDGLRVDHPDGLRDPGGYLQDLAGLTSGTNGPAYVLVEKILEPGEELLTSWATQGTTGYDALGWIDRVLTDPAGEAPLDALETRLRGAPVTWHRLVHDLKREVADDILGSEVRRIVREASGPPVYEAATEDERLVDAVAELLAWFPVYRSYLPDGRDHLDQAFASARDARPDLGPAYDELAVLLDPEHPAALRFQQTSGMVMAKGVEDCAFYRYSRLTSLNEVGGDPSVFSATTESFHAWALTRQREWPHAMTCLTTHDTKRGEDVRARIGVLAEIPGEWERALDQLLVLSPVPDPGLAALLWQAVVGVWGSSPDEVLRARLHAYAEKAMREAGERTRWTAPDEEYEAAVQGIIDAAFDDDRVRAVVTSLVERIEHAGWSNALSAKLLSLTLPGVPDVYQGSERSEQSLVDPDNRRPVDFTELAERIGSASTAAWPTDVASAKLALTRSALQLRRERLEPFGGYTPVWAAGPAAEHVLAFDRGGVLAVVTRLPLGLAQQGGFGATTLSLPPGNWHNVLAPGGDQGTVFQGAVRVTELLAGLPVAVLVQQSS